MNRVFVIEDDSLMRELLVRKLANRNFDVTAFADAADALDPIVVERPDLVVTDFRMPRMSGIELIRRVRAQGIGLPVIMVTAEPGAGLVEQAHALGVSHVFKKPLGDSSPFWTAVEGELDHPGDRLDALDGMRLELLTDLSHQLRTPLTATKLALEGLFSQIEGSLDSSQRQLASISCRNIDRLVALIERQLETLQNRIREDGTELGGGGGHLVGAVTPTRTPRD